MSDKGGDTHLLLKQAATNRTSGQWNDDDFDVLADGEVVGRIFKANAAPVGLSWMWTLIFPTTKGAHQRTAMKQRERRR